MDRPKCVACIECDGEVICDCCDFNKRDGCSCYSSFTREERIAALVDALKELGVEVPVWMPIDSAPKDGTVVLGFWMSTEDIHQIMPICYDDYTGWYAVDFFSSSDGGPKAYPTHWMPLLTKPKE